MLMLTLNDGPYKEGFDAVKAGALCPYVLDTQPKEKSSWENGFAFGSRTCQHCHQRTADTLIRCYQGRNICGKYHDTIEIVFGISPDQFICERCYRQRSSPQEHTAYDIQDVPRLLKYVLDKDSEAPYRLISYYALPAPQRLARGYDCFTIVTNGDRYDIKNPHIRESIEEMISMTKEAFTLLTAAPDGKQE